MSQGIPETHLSSSDSLLSLMLDLCEPLDMDLSFKGV